MNKQQQLTEQVMEELQSLLSEWEDGVIGCSDCLSGIVLSFTLTLEDGRELGRDELFFDNLVDAYDVDEAFIQRLFDHHPDLTEITFSPFCSSCLQLME